MNLIKFLTMFFLFAVLIFTACSEKEKVDEQLISPGKIDSQLVMGTVKYIALEGGFYGITTDDNKNLDPINLPKEFCVEGKRIKFSFVEKKDQASFHMWGTIVELSNLSSL